jgi:hypothetical protein
MAVFGEGGVLMSHRCLPDYDRPQTPRTKSIGLERRMKWVSDLGLLPIEIPSHLPWYDWVFPTPDGLVFRRVRTEAERDLVLVGPDGEAVATERWFPEKTFVGSGGILVAQDLPEGTAIRIYPNPWS